MSRIDSNQTQIQLPDSIKWMGQLCMRRRPLNRRAKDRDCVNLPWNTASRMGVGLRQVAQ